MPIVRAAGVDLHVHEAGDIADTSCELLLFLHGFPERAECWAPQLAALGPTHRCAAPEQRGYGRSGRPSGIQHYRVERLVADIEALANHYAANRFTLIGHDWGGLAAWFFAAAHPKRLHRLVIVNAPHPSRFQATLDADPAQRLASAYTRALTDPGFEANMLAVGPDIFWNAVFGDHLAQGELGPEVRAAQVADWSVPGALTAMTDWYRASPFSFPELPPGPCAERPFPNFHVPAPTTIIWGMDDFALLPTQLDGLDRWVPDLMIHRVPGAGHGILHQRPALVSELIAGSLR